MAPGGNDLTERRDEQHNDLQQKLCHRFGRHVDHASFHASLPRLSGQYLPMSQAKISVLDWFVCLPTPLTTRACLDGRFLRLDLHLDRFLRWGKAAHDKPFTARR
ncbi:hypothetical protein ACFSQT_37565 [Mesorhizobium calcicola]|uniref:Branched-chain-amino-acid aminotransferase n=1 Tax=Mesorhizobium calcicola TaxID=1300310 RepID=A0ABW4WRT8_9HYPH